MHIVLTAPKSTRELEANLAALEAPRMTARDRARWQEFGDLLYGSGNDRFETEWP